MFQIPPAQTPLAQPLPAAPALLLRALLKRGARAGDAMQVPATVFDCTALDAPALGRYKALLGFSPDTLPVSAHYLLAQRAHLATMLSPRFPFRLLGMVHVENSITEHAAAVPGRLLRLATTLRVEPPTRSGARFCVLETTAWDGDTRVFGCTSKYLTLAGRKDGTRKEAEPAPSLPECAGWQVAHDEGRAYARVSGDWNPIHLAAWPARLFGLRRPIIHGMHSVAKAVATLEAQGERVSAVSVRFRSTVPLGSTVRLLHAPGAPDFVLLCDGRVAVEGSVVFARR